jgi:hypothetical protein
LCHIATADKPPTIWRPRDDNAEYRFTYLNPIFVSLNEAIKKGGNCQSKIGE